MFKFISSHIFSPICDCLRLLFVLFGYNCIYMFSYFQIKYNKQIASFTSLNSSDNCKKYLYHIDVFNIKKNMFEFVNSCDCLEPFDKLRQLYCVDKLNDVIMIKNNSTKLFKIINSAYFDNQSSLDEVWTPTKYKFISLSVIYKGNTYEIDVSNINYYVVGNLIDDCFIKYFMQKYHNVTIESDDSDNNKYTLTIMDHKFKLLVLNGVFCIHLKENNYLLMGFPSKSDE